MKVICDRAALLEAVNLVAAVVPQRTPTPSLSCVKITATKDAKGGGELTLAGSDAETSLHLTLNKVDVAEPGQAVIPADKLRQIVSAEEGEPTLTIETDGDQAVIRGQNARFRVYGYPPAEYPPLPDFAAVVSGKGPEVARTIFSHDAASLIDAIGRTVFAAARETSRYAINGVLLKRDGKKLEFVATDGRRLALARCTVKDGGGSSSGGSISCIVPTKALNLIPKIARAADDIVRIAITDSRIFVAIDPPGESAAAPRAVLTSTLVEGAFPPYEEAIPKDQDKKIVAHRDDLSLAVRKAAVLTNEESRGVRMNFDAAGKRLTLSSRAPEMGDAEIGIDLVDYSGEDIEISFNPAFLTDVLKVLDDDDVIIELKTSGKQGLIRSAAGDFVYVVMPVNLPT